MGQIKYLDVDISDLQGVVDKLKIALSPQKMEKVLHDTCVDTARYVKTIVGQEVPKEYDVTKRWVQSGIGRWRSEDGNHIGVVIPLTGKRGQMGRKRMTFKAANPRGRLPRNRRYRLTAHILRRRESTLPETMKHQGDQPPFIAKKEGVVYTRKFAKQAHPIVRVVGLGVPQMPLNRAEDSVRERIHERMALRLNHHFDRALGIKR